MPYVQVAGRRGSSPRVRSRPFRGAGNNNGIGIISACAEQTRGSWCLRSFERDHLRVCGADSYPNGPPLPERGSSPRVRSRRAETRGIPRQGGIISACAEQTLTSRLASLPAGDHLRVCGADSSSTPIQRRPSGSSPRVRSRPIVRRDRERAHGIISACAEQTWATW